MSFTVQRRIAWREWDGEVVAYDEASGATHLLSQATGSILSLLSNSGCPLDSTAILHRLGHRADGGDGLDIVAIDAILSELERIKLVARVAQ
jgi:PqqD family protein of HPr-rel-A system